MNYLFSPSKNYPSNIALRWEIKDNTLVAAYGQLITRTEFNLHDPSKYKWEASTYTAFNSYAINASEHIAPLLLALKALPQPIQQDAILYLAKGLLMHLDDLYFLRPDNWNYPMGECNKIHMLFNAFPELFELMPLHTLPSTQLIAIINPMAAILFQLLSVSHKPKGKFYLELTCVLDEMGDDSDYFLHLNDTCVSNGLTIPVHHYSLNKVDLDLTSIAFQVLIKLKKLGLINYTIPPLVPSSCLPKETSQIITTVQHNIENKLKTA